MTEQNQHPLKRDGTGQRQRFPAALDASYVQVDERSMNDLLQFAAEFAKEVKFFDASHSVAGDWQNLFSFDQKLLDDINSRSDVQPHYALFIAFLRLFQIAQNDLNQFTRRHLDFYYEKVLGLAKRDGEPDKVHVIFDLAKNVSQHLLAKDTPVDAGKDASGKNLRYKLEDQIIVNTAKISDLRSVYRSPQDHGIIRFASQANSGDGMGSALDENHPQWDAFGNARLPQAQIGFAIASPILLLKEGNRRITVKIAFDNELSAPDEDSTTNAFELYFSSEKEWMGPIAVSPEIITSGENATGLSFTGTIDAGQPAVVNFDSGKLSGNFPGASPVMQVKIVQPGFLSFIGNAKVKSVRVDVDVSGVTSLAVENDQSPLNAKKAFMPFGPQPVKGSSFYIGYEELLYKDLTGMSLTIEWLDAPADFSDHYSGYPGIRFKRAVAGEGLRPAASALRSASPGLSRSATIPVQFFSAYTNSSFTAGFYLRDKFQCNVGLFNHTDAAKAVTIPPQPVTHARLKFSSLDKARLTPGRMFRNPDLTSLKGVLAKPLAPVESAGSRAEDFVPEELKTRFIRLELLRDFGHKIYPSVLTNSIQNNRDTPNAPYTPTIKSVSLSYRASTGEVNVNETTPESYLLKDLQLLHVDVFGTAEQHGYLKSQIPFPVERSIPLIPQHRSEGEFCFSIEDAAPLQTVNVLFQLSEGTANPVKEAQDISWFVLCANEWKLLTGENILSDATNHLLRSGIIRFYLPQEATNDNTILEAGKYWIKGVIEKDTDAVCKFIALHPQAALAIFDDGENDVNHLAASLPANTISKLVTKNAAIKTITQPYASFEGRLREDSTSFYTRVSERLRHKQRAVAIWDYERIILQQFPSIYKVKCLSHSSEQESCCACRRPGQVTLVVVPDLKNKTPVDPLKPKAPLDTLTAIEDYLKKMHSMFIEVHTRNPEYEELQLDFKVQFKRNYEFGFYSKKLNDDLIRYLSPWAFSPSFEISFGGRVHKSVILNFIEELEYVDFITSFKMYHRSGENPATKDVNEIEVINPSAILVSSANHLINPVSANDVCE
jgi:hypothetical protein